MSRAVLLPTTADPFHLSYWLENYKKWSKFVDQLYILHNTPYPGDLMPFNKGVNFKYIREKNQVQHGDAINTLLSICKEDYVMLVEDDGFIISPEYIDFCFKALENNEAQMVGGRRGSCGEDIYLAGRKKFGFQAEADGSDGPGFWPNFFFTKREFLERTDHNFNAKSWNKGDVITELDLTIQNEVTNADTFVWGSIQLQAQGLSFKHVPQYHANPYDIEHAEGKLYLFDGGAPWLHVGSLSSGFHGVLMTPELRPIGNPAADPSPDFPRHCNTDPERREWERRVTWWKTFYEHASKEDKERYAELYKQYDYGLSRLIGEYSLDTARIQKMQDLYEGMGL